jgi:hypothetical protein
VYTDETYFRKYKVPSKVRRYMYYVLYTHVYNYTCTIIVALNGIAQRKVHVGLLYTYVYCTEIPS